MISLLLTKCNLIQEYKTNCNKYALIKIARFGFSLQYCNKYTHVNRHKKYKLFSQLIWIEFLLYNYLQKKLILVFACISYSKYLQDVSLITITNSHTFTFL